MIPKIYFVFETSLVELDSHSMRDKGVFLTIRFIIEFRNSKGLTHVKPSLLFFLQNAPIS